MKRLKEGNVYSKTLDNGVTYYLHLIRMHPKHGPIVRVYSTPELDPSSQVLGTIGAAIKDAIKIMNWVYHSWVQPPVSIGPLLWFSIPRAPNYWYFVPEGAPPEDDYPGISLGYDLPDEYRDFFRFGNYGIGYVEQMIVTGKNIYDIDWLNKLRIPLQEIGEEEEDPEKEFARRLRIGFGGFPRAGSPPEQKS